jgi:hypothetical protein
MDWLGLVIIKEGGGRPMKIRTGRGYASKRLKKKGIHVSFIEKPAGFENLLSHGFS